MSPAAREEGFTLVELLVTMTILGIVMAAITGLFVSGTRAQSDLNSRFTALTELHIGLDRFRRDVHSACSVTSQSATSVTFSGPPCDGSNLYTWCTQATGGHYGLYRAAGASCGGIRYTDYLIGGSIFGYVAPNSPPGSYALGRLHLDVTVDANPSDAAGRFRVVDDVVFRNSPRCIVGTNCP